MKAVFLDRDGTINIDRQYVHKIEDFEFIPGAIEALKTLQEAGFALVVISNQSGVGRGYYTEAEYQKITKHLKDELRKHGIILAGTYACFHHIEGKHPYNVVCDCRKPLPGMFIEAEAELGIDMKRSFAVGDKWADIKAARNADLPYDHCILVKTGKGGSDGEPVVGAPIVENLAAATRYILESLHPQPSNL